MVPPGDVSLVSKQDCNRAGSLPRAVLTHVRQTPASQTTQPVPTQSTATQKRRGAPLIFFKWSADYWGLVPHSPLAGCSAAPGALTWKAPVVTFWNFIWEQAGAQDSKINEGSRFTALKFSPERLIKKSLCIYKLEHLCQRKWGTCPVIASWSNHPSKFLSALTRLPFLFPH